MNATVTPINRRIDLQLNVAFAFEALILKRLLNLPKMRQNEWLRGLLVLGFQHECAAIKSMQCTEEASSDSAWQHNIIAQPLTSAAKQHGAMDQPESIPERIPAAIQRSGNTVSFAALRKVVG